MFKKLLGVILTKDDIDILKDIGQSCTFWIIFSLPIILSAYIFIINYEAAYKEHIPISHKSYINVNVNISYNKIKGKLNNYITTKHLNNKCYKQNCGFASSGDYLLSKIEFVQIGKEYFLHFACLDNLGNKCYYNISDKFIEDKKKYLISKAKDDMIWCWHILLWGLLGVFIDFKMRHIRIKNENSFFK